ncbi:hypothetical protein ETA_10740 [Erwinia tasmaniensis Et1/99]|uniref:Uncharacterized protein n=1 Tax=Erwinia tasmaniensis (strain DSM 17950 / CFBP 7177 / CIP 109463 / NCPPB 4357 / Et1/99) TaxID=465817 RepID=B2VE52_ERWT9|nr:hypothetical protein ETA_10740 [Erwinia tasmaniensis Et1/99]
MVIMLHLIDQKPVENHIKQKGTSVGIGRTRRKTPGYASGITTLSPSLHPAVQRFLYRLLIHMGENKGLMYKPRAKNRYKVWIETHL